jgi:hypothetical protein
MQFHAHISLAAIASGGAVLHRKFLIRSIAFYGDLVQCQLIVAVGKTVTMTPICGFEFARRLHTNPIN